MVKHSLLSHLLLFLLLQLLPSLLALLLLQPVFLKRILFANPPSALVSIIHQKKILLLAPCSMILVFSSWDISLLPLPLVMAQRTLSTWLFFDAMNVWIIARISNRSSIDSKPTHSINRSSRSKVLSSDRKTSFRDKKAVNKKVVPDKVTSPLPAPAHAAGPAADPDVAGRSGGGVDANALCKCPVCSTSRNEYIRWFCSFWFRPQTSLRLAYSQSWPSLCVLLSLHHLHHHLLCLLQPLLPSRAHFS